MPSCPASVRGLGRVLLSAEPFHHLGQLLPHMPADLPVRGSAAGQPPVLQGPRQDLKKRGNLVLGENDREGRCCCVDHAPQVRAPRRGSGSLREQPVGTAAYGSKRSHQMRFLSRILSLEMKQ